MANNILRGLAVLPILAMLLIVGALPTQAADLRAGDTIIVASGDVVNDDLYLAANLIIINGIVNGDVFCAGATINVNGKINGSIMAVGETINIVGEVTHSVRIGGANINVSGTIGGDLVVAGADVDLTSAAIIYRDLLIAGNNVKVDTYIGDSIRGFASTMELNAGVAGDVEIVVDKLTIASSANIHGDLIYTSNNDAVIQSGATVIGTTTHTIPPTDRSMFFNSDWSDWANWGGRLIGFLMILVTGFLFVLIAPQRASAVATSIKTKPWSSLGWGALILFVTPIVLLICLITIVGIPLGLLGIFLYITAIFLSQIAVGLFIGHMIIGSFSKVDSRGALLGAFTIGFSILTLLNLIPVIGPLLWLVTILFGLGAMIVSQRVLHPKDLIPTTEMVVN